MTRTLPLLFALVLPFSAGSMQSCKKSRHARVSSYTPPPLPAGFVTRSGSGWRAAMPATWKDAPQREASWAAEDPQVVDDFHANANVLVEPFAGDSYDYARANEAALRQKQGATVEAAREDVVDGDATLVFETRWAAGQPAPMPIRTMQAALASRGTGYVVTCSVAAASFERYRSTCDSIVHSFAVER